MKSCGDARGTARLLGRTCLEFGAERIVLFGGSRRALLERGHDRAWRSAARPRTQYVHLLGSADDHGFDAPIATIADPALQAEPGGLAAYRGAKTDALDTSRNHQMQGGDHTTPPARSSTIFSAP